MGSSSAGGGSGLFLAFEGVEGSGKTTQVQRLVTHLQRLGFSALSAREPGETVLGERVRELVLADAGFRVPPRSELFLMLAARVAFVEEIVRPALAAGKVVIADRFELSTLAYQGAARGLPSEEVRACNRFATDGVSPHATFLLELEPGEGARRQAKAGKTLDRLEREDPGFHARVAAGYREFASQVEGTLRIDASGTADAVHHRVVQALSARFPETFPAGEFTREEPSAQASGAFPFQRAPEEQG